MMKFEPEAVYSAKDLKEMSGFSFPTVYEWFKDPKLKSFQGPGGKMATGQALLDYFGAPATEGEEKPEPITGTVGDVYKDVDMKTKMKLKKMGLRVM